MLQGCIQTDLRVESTRTSERKTWLSPARSVSGDGIRSKPEVSEREAAYELLAAA